MHKRKFGENEDFQPNQESCDGCHSVSNQVERGDCLWEQTMPQHPGTTLGAFQRKEPAKGKPKGKGKRGDYRGEIELRIRKG